MARALLLLGGAAVVVMVVGEGEWEGEGQGQWQGERLGVGERRFSPLLHDVHAAMRNALRPP